jgi:shikimate dehydrogenase
VTSEIQPDAARRCAVLGSPVDHSLSPLLHRTAYARLGLNWTYTAHEVTEQTLPAFLVGLDPSWRGLSLTMPLKRAVLPLLDDVEPVARSVEAVNTVLLSPGRRFGANTDVSGLLTALRTAMSSLGESQPAGHAIVVGAGATAASALAALSRLGVDSVDLRVRDLARAHPTLLVGDRLGLEVRVLPLDAPWQSAPWAVSSVPSGGAVVVSTVPSAVAVEVLPENVLSGAVVADVRYDPWPSPLLAVAQRRGSATVTGIDLLVHQAVAQVRLMTGQEVAADALLEAAEAAVRRRAAEPPRG